MVYAIIMTIEISQEEFEVFILVYAAFADFKEMPLEKNFIIQKFSKERYNEATALYTQLAEPERVQVILHHLEDFQDAKKAERIKTDVKTLLDFDGFNRFEESFYTYLKEVSTAVNN